MKLSTRKKDIIFNKNDGSCSICSKKLQRENHRHGDNYFHIDHLIPRSVLSNNSIENLMPICRSCNSSKSNRRAIDLIYTLENKIESSFSKFLFDFIKYEQSHSLFSTEEALLLIDSIESTMNEKIIALKELINDNRA